MNELKDSRRGKAEILAPAGSMESLYAAVRCGADGVYVGGKQFSARANAVNFSSEELEEAADYCHLHGVKLYRAMNTVLLDSECEDFVREVKHCAQIGIDGIIVQDLGGVLLIKSVVPNMPVHASTQMTIHTPLGALAAQRLGVCRIVPARELSLEKITDICSTGLETEVFVHGAQCMCVSGQCYMSAVIGSRSANRGQCAQACRLPFSADGKNGEYALSLKDMCLVPHIQKLIDAGAASFKIEGRMKRPEYVAAAVTALRNAADKTGDTAEDMERLEAVFSRSGFTDGYLMGKTGEGMFGYRRKEDVTAAGSVLPQLAALYKNERKCVGISFDFKAHRDCAATLSFTAGNVSGEISGNIPEAARNRSLSEDDIAKQLSKLGDTVYELQGISAEIDEGIMLPASEINRMRREACALADRLIVSENTPKYSVTDNAAPLRRDSRRKGTLVFRIKSDRYESIAEISADAELIILPVKECERLDDSISKEKIAVSLPAFVQDEGRLMTRLRALREKGFVHFYCENFTHCGVLSELDDIIVHGGTGMNITNSYSLIQCQKLGFADVTVSFELKAAHISALKSPVPIGIYAYGRLPLMTVRCCPLKSSAGCKKCTHILTDRTGRKFPVLCGEGYSQIYNSDILETSDKLEGFGGISFAMLDFTGLSSEEVHCIFDRYKSGGKPSGSFTRGLYSRGVI